MQLIISSSLLSLYYLHPISKHSLLIISALSKQHGKEKKPWKKAFMKFNKKVLALLTKEDNACATPKAWSLLLTPNERTLYQV